MKYLLFLLVILTTHLPAEIAVNSHLEHIVHNLETEASYLKQKIENQETTIESLREEVSVLIKATKELNAKSQISQDAKLVKMEKNLEKLIGDMKQFKTNVNANAELLSEMQKTIRHQAEANKLQEKQIENLEAAIKSLARAMQTSISPSKESSSKTYRVRNGDSLAEIAKNNSTTTTKIKQLNGLLSDKIIVGQELKIP